LALVASLAMAPSVHSQESPSHAVDQARRAHIGDSVAAVSARWTATLGNRPDDPSALLGLATLARLTYDYPLSDSLFRRLRDVSEERTSTRAEAFRGMAHLRFIAGDLAAGDSLSILGAQHAEAAADTTLWVQLSFLRTASIRRIEGPDEEARLLDRIDRRIPPGVSELRAEWSCRTGSRLAYLGDPAAYDTIQEGLAAAREVQSDFGLALCLKTLGEYGVARGMADSAIVWLGQAARAAQAMRNDVAAAAILQWRGYTNLEAGHYGQALADLERAVAHATISQSVASEAWSLLNLARIALHLGDIEGGMRSLHRADSLFVLMGDTWGLAVAHRIEGHLAVSGGAWAEADSLYREVLAWAEESGIAGEQLSLHQELANVAVMREDWDDAQHHIRQGHRVARAYDLGRAANGLAYVSGLLALRQGDTGGAAAAFRQYASGLSQGQHAYHYAARARLAETLAVAGDLDQAERDIINAAAELDRFRGSLSTIELRRFVFQIGVDPYDTDLGVATVISHLAVDGRIETAFAVSEGRRAREMADRLLQAREIEDTSSTTNAGRSGTPFVTVTEVQRALPAAGTVLIEYVIGRGSEPTTAFIVGRDVLRSVELAPHSHFSEDLARFVVLLESGASSDALSRRLAAMILDPIIDSLPPGTDQLIIVADGSLHRVPFDALRLADGRWAIEAYETATVPSAAIAVHLWHRTSPDREATVLAYGDPDFGGGTGGPTGSGDRWQRAAGDSLERLAQSGREARRVARFGTSAEVRVGRQATEASLKHLPTDQYRVLHFATHALVDEVAVNRAGLALTPGDGEDGFVTPSELSYLSLTADLVVLSACRTAGGVVVDGEGMQGLTAPLLEAGARSIVATHWPIGDKATVAAMETFYGAMARGLPVGAALREMKLALIADGAAINEWASFEVIGDPLASPPLRAPTPPYGYWGAGLLLLTLVGYFGWKRTRHGTART